jgi:hypothetical protein
MSEANSESSDQNTETKLLPPAAQRALAEAELRRIVQTDKERKLARDRELAGRGGKDPVRYNDWEIKGLASDF